MTFPAESGPSQRLSLVAPLPSATDNALNPRPGFGAPHIPMAPAATSDHPLPLGDDPAAAEYRRTPRRACRVQAGEYRPTYRITSVTSSSMTISSGNGSVFSVTIRVSDARTTPSAAGQGISRLEDESTPRGMGRARSLMAGERRVGGWASRPPTRAPRSRQTADEEPSCGSAPLGQSANIRVTRRRSSRVSSAFFDAAAPRAGRRRNAEIGFADSPPIDQLPRGRVPEPTTRLHLTSPNRGTAAGPASRSSADVIK